MLRMIYGVEPNRLIMLHYFRRVDTLHVNSTEIIKRQKFVTMVGLFLDLRRMFPYFEFVSMVSVSVIAGFD